MLGRGSVRVAINAQLPRGAAGGVEQNLVRMVSALTKSCREETFLLVGPGRQSDWLLPLVAGRHQLVRGVWEDRSAWGRLMRRLRRWSLRNRESADNWDLLRPEGVDVVHFPYQTHYPVQVPFLFEPWDLQHLHLPEFFTLEETERRERVYREGCDKASLVVTATEWTKQDIIAKYGIAPQKIATVRRGVFGEEHTAPSARSAERILAPLKLPSQFLFFPAKDFPHKNHARLFEAVAKLRRGGIDANLVCCGRVLDRNKAIWRERLTQLGIRRHVRCLGRVEDEVVRALFVRAKALVFPSLFEGLAIPILEAMQVGLPVVTTRQACIPEVAGEAALYADGWSSDSLAEAIATLYTDPEVAENCRRLGRRESLRFDWRPAADAFLACYRVVAGRDVGEIDAEIFQRVTGSEVSRSHLAA